MHYYVLAPFFFASVLIGSIAAICAIFRPGFYAKHRAKVRIFLAAWFVPYAAFILLFTGPRYLRAYPPRERSPYKLPWQGGVRRFVAQGNRSFTSHRDFHEFAWDFAMPNGTEILAAREGRVLEINDGFDGIGWNSNVITLEHADGQRSAYAHIRYHGALVRVGDWVKQGQPIALSGMVGQTIFPHVHFLVINPDATASVPISFSDVPGSGVPLAGHFYTSGNAP